MSRTREWMKFGSLIGITAVLGIALVSVVDLPSRSLAQQPSLSALANRPAPVQAAQPVVDLGNAFAAAAEAVRPAVVFITTEATRSVPNTHPNIPEPFDRFFQIPDPGQQMPRQGQGSGFIVSPDGYIMTNNHVVEGADRVTVRLLDGREFTADLVGRDPNTDVAIIKIDEDDLPTVSFGDSDTLRIGDWVLAIGNPLGVEFSFTVTAGIVSGRGRRLNGLQQSEWSISDFIQTDAAINPGNSGGPLANINGQVVGVNAAIASQTGYYAGYSFAIPINLARTVADQLISEGHVTRAALGVSVVAATAADAEYVGLDVVRGVTVQGFPSDDSPAMRAGIQPGDVIIEVDGQRIDYVAQLQQLVGFKRPGERVRVTVARAGGERETLTVELTEAQSTVEPRVAAVEPNTPPEKESYEEKLGIRVQELSPQMAAQVRRIDENVRGVMITAVDPQGPARQVLRASLPRQGRLVVITQVNGQPVEALEQFNAAVARVEPGSIVSLRVFLVEGNQTVPQVVRYRVGE